MLDDNNECLGAVDENRLDNPPTTGFGDEVAVVDANEEDREVNSKSYDA